MSLVQSRIFSILSNHPKRILCLSLHMQTHLYTSDKILEEKTPFGKISDAAKTKDESLKSDEKNERDPYAPFPDATNPVTGEIGGPLGPEPTRYGDWERKGRCSDF